MKSKTTNQNRGNNMTWTAKVLQQDTKSTRSEDREEGQSNRTQVLQKGRESETEEDTNPMHISEICVLLFMFLSN